MIEPSQLLRSVGLIVASPDTKETIQFSAGQKRVRVPPDGPWELLCYCLLPTARDVLLSWEEQFITVVVSPLAALMKDHVIAVSQRIVRPAYVRNAKERRRRSERRRRIKWRPADRVWYETRKFPAGVPQSRSSSWRLNLAGHVPGSTRITRRLNLKSRNRFTVRATTV